MTTNELDTKSRERAESGVNKKMTKNKINKAKNIEKKSHKENNGQSTRDKAQTPKTKTPTRQNE